MKHLARLLAFVCLFAPLAAHAGDAMDYFDGETELEGYWAPSTCGTGKPAPTVLIAHQWMGITDHEKGRADMLAKECYNAFVLDMYGKGVKLKDTDEAGKMAGMYKNDAVLGRKRVTAALDYVRKLDGVVDTNNIAIMGFCFGGTMALELARTGANIKGAISFHGGLATKAPAKPGTITAPIQVHHGADDPYVPHEEVHNFMKEMNAADADWELTQYANAVHSFTQKEAGNDPSKGAAYNEKADKRSWQSALDFLKEIFAS